MFQYPLRLWFEPFSFGRKIHVMDATERPILHIKQKGGDTAVSQPSLRRCLQRDGRSLRPQAVVYVWPRLYAGQTRRDALLANRFIVWQPVDGLGD